MTLMPNKPRAWTWGILLGIVRAHVIGMFLMFPSMSPMVVVDAAWTTTPAAAAAVGRESGPKLGVSRPACSRELQVSSLSSDAERMRVIQREELLSLPAKTTTAASRRDVLLLSGTWWPAMAAIATTTTMTTLPPAASAEETVAATAEGSSVPKFVQEYSDFVESPLGFSYRVVPSPTSTASSAVAAKGDRVVFDWSGYTIGYFGRPFQAKGGPQGGAFDKDLDYARVVLGSHSIVRGLELALEGMRAGEVRQVIVPYGKLSYPNDDPGHDRVGPKPSTFSGERALDFVLQNPRLDRTLLFNVKVIRVDKPNGKGGFVRG